MSETTTEVTAPEAEAPEVEAPAAESDEKFDADRAMAKIRKANDEAKGLRARVKDLEAYEAKVREIEESQKSESQKVQERADRAEQRAKAVEAELIRERIARRHKIDDDDLDLLGTGTEVELETRAKKIAALKAAALEREATVPPSDKPVEKLRPGATPSDVDLRGKDAYPSSWRTARTQTRKE
jgi:phage protein D